MKSSRVLLTLCQNRAPLTRPEAASMARTLLIAATSEPPLSSARGISSCRPPTTSRSPKWKWIAYLSRFARIHKIIIAGRSVVGFACFTRKPDKILPTTAHSSSLESTCPLGYPLLLVSLDGRARVGNNQAVLWNPPRLRAPVQPGAISNAGGGPL